MKVELTSHCKHWFTEWYKEYEPKSDWAYPAYDYFTNHSIEYQLSVAISWFDKQEIFIHVEPYLGGGQPVFYGKIHYREMQHNQTVETNVMDNDQYYYCIDRLEMLSLCIDLCNKYYNSVYKEEFKPEDLTEKDDLPF